MGNFEDILIRLKQQLGVATDKEAASVLGLTPSAFNDRKKRGSFPLDKLRALKASMPKLNVDYILTGSAAALIAADLTEAKRELIEYERTLNVFYGVSDAERPDAELAERAAKVATNFRILSEQGRLAVEAMINALLETNEGNGK